MWRNLVDLVVKRNIGKMIKMPLEAGMLILDKLTLSSIIVEILVFDMSIACMSNVSN